MSYKVGKDKEGKCWFKSNQFITDITSHRKFFVQKESNWMFWRKPKYLLYGIIVIQEAKYRYPSIREGWIEPITKNILLGVYDDEDEASIALDQIMLCRGIKEIEFIPKKL